MAKIKKNIEIHNEKYPMYRSVHADGAIGSVTPSNKIALSFYSSRKVIPKSVMYELNDKGLIEKALAVSKDSKKGIIREIEFSVYMDKSVAIKLYNYLKNTLDNDESR